MAKKKQQEALRRPLGLYILLLRPIATCSYSSDSGAARIGVPIYNPLAVGRAVMEAEKKARRDADEASSDHLSHPL